MPNTLPLTLLTMKEILISSVKTHISWRWTSRHELASYIDDLIRRLAILKQYCNTLIQNNPYKLNQPQLGDFTELSGYKYNYGIPLNYFKTLLNQQIFLVVNRFLEYPVVNVGYY